MLPELDLDYLVSHPLEYIALVISFAIIGVGSWILIGAYDYLRKRGNKEEKTN